MKMSAAAGNPGGALMAQQAYVDRQPTYGYDPMTHGGYGAVDDYAPYPHLATTHSQHGGDDYHTMRNSQNPSRQDYCSDPYAAVHKPKKRLDQHLGKCTELNIEHQRIGHDFCSYRITKSSLQKHF